MVNRQHKVLREKTPTTVPFYPLQGDKVFCVTFLKRKKEN
jgi:hypothetical protein